MSAKDTKTFPQYWQCPRCSYATRYGNAQRVRLHEIVSHGSNAPVLTEQK